MRGVIWDGKVLSTIAENHDNSTEFLDFSNGKIPKNSQVLLLSRDISCMVSDDHLPEYLDLPPDDVLQILDGIIRRESLKSVHLIRIDTRSN